MSAELNDAIVIVIWICGQVLKGHGSIHLIKYLRRLGAGTGWVVINHQEGKGPMMVVRITGLLG
jgi:hypothetical protein